MAKKKRTVTKKKITKGSKSKRNAFINFAKSERTHFLFGVVAAFIGLFIFLSMISFLFTGEADFSEVTNKTFFELVNDKNVSVDNWTSTGGAFIAQKMINNGFGIFSIFIPVFVILMGLKWMKVWEGSLTKHIIFASLTIIFGSISAAFINKLFPLSFIRWGGVHGETIENILENSIGWPGIVLLMVLFAIILIVLFKKSSMFTIQNTLSKGIERINNNGAESNEDDTEFDNDNASEPEKRKQANKISKAFAFLKRKKRPKESDNEDELEDEGNDDDNEETSLTKKITLHKKPSLETSTPEKEDKGFEVIVPKEEEMLPEGEIEKPPTTTSVTDKGELVDEETGEVLEDYDPTKDLSSFEFPSMSLLKTYDVGS